MLFDWLGMWPVVGEALQLLREAVRFRRAIVPARLLLPVVLYAALDDVICRRQYSFDHLNYIENTSMKILEI